MLGLEYVGLIVVMGVDNNGVVVYLEEISMGWGYDSGYYGVCIFFDF